MSDEQVPAQTPDPSNFPAHHPLRQLGAALGVASEVAGPPPGGGDNPNASRPTTSYAQAAQAAQAPVVDPLSRTYQLPSGGLVYPGHDGTVVISPMRGEQEEMIAGSGVGVSATPAIRHVVEQCLDTRGVPYEQLVVEDWAACLLHILAMSLGSDHMPMFPQCPGCAQHFDGSRSLSDVPCRVLKRALPGESTTWPPQSSADEDEDLRILREMGLDPDSSKQAQQVFAVDAVVEPAEVKLANGQVIGWRYLRLNDLIQAEEFSERSQSGTTNAGSRLHGFIQARYIASIDGRTVGVIDSMRWVKQAPLPLLRELRESIERRSFGYELRPTFQCTHCRHRFRHQLSLDGSMFRDGSTGV